MCALAITLFPRSLPWRFLTMMSGSGDGPGVSERGLFRLPALWKLACRCAVLAFVSFGAHHERYPILLATAAVIIALNPLWYWRAVVATDNRELAIRALINVGRKPLAEALGLQLPGKLSREREMWSQYGRFVERPYEAANLMNFGRYRKAARCPADAAQQHEGSSQGNRITLMARSCAGVL